MGTANGISVYNEELTYRELYQWGCVQLAQAEISELQLDARLLLEYCCSTDRNTLLAHGERRISAEEYGRYADCIARRKGHVPLQHIIGEQDFMGLTFIVNGNVLIPRQDTEVLVEEVMRHLHDGMRILDLCTGSGCILLSLLHYSNGCTGVGVDVSEEALRVAEENAERILGIRMRGQEQRQEQRQSEEQGQSQEQEYSQEQRQIQEVKREQEQSQEQWQKQEERRTQEQEQKQSVSDTQSKFSLIQSDLFENLDAHDKYDIIVSNPPYIKTSVIDTLMPEVREHEPYIALDGREDGLFFYREIIAQAGGYLAGGGMLFFEIGYDQSEEVRRLMECAGYTDVEIIKDFAGLDRVVCGVYKMML